MTDAPESRITDLRKLKVFTHPLRIRLYRLLHADPPATASHLAAQVDETVSLVSYHLRTLAEHGFIEEDDERHPDGRQRWWRPTSAGGWGYRVSDFGQDPVGAGVASDVARQLLAQRGAAVERFVTQQPAWPTEWSDAAFFSEYHAPLTAAEVSQLSAELTALLRRWRAHGQAAHEAGDTEGRERVQFHLNGFPERS